MQYAVWLVYFDRESTPCILIILDFLSGQACIKVAVVSSYACNFSDEKNNLLFEWLAIFRNAGFQGGEYKEWMNGCFEFPWLNSMTSEKQFLLHKNKSLSYFFFFMNVINNDGNSTRLVTVAVTSVREVSQPSDCVPPNPLKQKMTKPAIRTSDV